MSHRLPTLLRVCLREHPLRPGEMWVIALHPQAKVYTNINTNIDKTQIAALLQERKVLVLFEESGLEDFNTLSSEHLSARVDRLLLRLRQRLVRGESLQALLTSIHALRHNQCKDVLKPLVIPSEKQEDLRLAEILEREHFEQLERSPLAETRREKMLLHVCCGPDAAGVMDQLKSEFDLTAFWYDPNIQPRAEHDRRLEAFIKVCELKGVSYRVGEYDVDRFLFKIKGLEHTPEQGAKCTFCYDMRLERAAREARDQNCDLFTTTLAISPHKVQKKLAHFGELHGTRYQIPYFAKNFMKSNGFKESVNFTREHEIYRQDYCGCWFSLHEGGPAARAFAEQSGLTEPKDFATLSLDNEMDLTEYWAQLAHHQNTDNNALKKH